MNALKRVPYQDLLIVTRKALQGLPSTKSSPFSWEAATPNVKYWLGNKISISNQTSVIRAIHATMISQWVPRDLVNSFRDE